MTPREQIDFAARAMGLVIDQYLEPGAVYAYPKDASLNADGEPNGLHLWRPFDDQADSDRMAAYLLIDSTWYTNCVVACAANDRHLVESGHRVSHNNTIEDKYRAVREARLAVAVQDPNTPPRDLAALSRRLIEVAKDIEAIEQEDGEDERGGGGGHQISSRLKIKLSLLCELSRLPFRPRLICCPRPGSPSS